MSELDEKVDDMLTAAFYEGADVASMEDYVRLRRKIIEWVKQDAGIAYGLLGPSVESELPAKGGA